MTLSDVASFTLADVQCVRNHSHMWRWLFAQAKQEWPGESILYTGDDDVLYFDMKKQKSLSTHLMINKVRNHWIVQTHACALKHAGHA